jgi:RES domain-containing protein
LIAGATSLQGDFFRSVAFRYFHPDDVISGEGTRLSGGRFVPVGVRAVYASLDEETALREVTCRKIALGGRKQISVGEYPRMTYVLSVATRRNLDLAVTLPSETANVVRLCLRGPGYYVSQELATIWISEGIDSVVFPSATGAGRNVAVYLANAAADSVLVRNRAEVLGVLRQPRVGKRGRQHTVSMCRGAPGLTFCAKTRM